MYSLKVQEEEIKKFQNIEPMLKKELELAHEVSACGMICKNERKINIF